MIRSPGMARVPKRKPPNRTHTEQIGVRCNPELYAAAKALADAHNVTAAQILAAGVLALQQQFKEQNGKKPVWAEELGVLLPQKQSPAR